MLKITKNQGSIQVTADKSGFYPFDGTIIFPTNSLFTATSANTDMITFKSTSNGDVQFVGNYKDITISGRSYDTKQKFLTAFSNLANQGSVDAYTKAETDAKIDAKQGKLKAGNGITLTEDATDGTTVVKTAVSLTDNGNGAYTVGDGIAIDSKSSVRIGKKWTQEIEDMTDRVTTIAIGYDARTNDTQGGGDIAIGDGAQSFSVGAVGSIAIGKDTMANAPTGHASIVIGSGAKVTKTNADGIVIGSGAKVNDGSDSIVIGNNARTETSSDSVAIGSGTFSKQPYGIAIGRGAGAEVMPKSSNGESIAIGHFARADGNASIALGYYSKGQKGGVAIGESSKAKAEKGIAIGKNAMASVENGVAIGELAQTAADMPLVICAGNKTVDGQKLPITMIQGDANGKISLLKGDGTDTRMVIQDEIEALKNAGGSGGTVDAYTKAETDTKLEAKQDKLTAGSGITITKDETAGTSTIATAVSLTDNGDGAYQVGDSIKMGDGIAIGKYAYSYYRNSVAVGSNAHASGEEAVAIGNYSVATKDTPLVIRAGYKIVGNSKKILTVLQSDANGKISIIKGDDPDERIVIQDEIEALKNAGGGGAVDAYTKAETDTKLDAKQDKLKAGNGITLTEDATDGTTVVKTAVSLTDNGNGAYQVGDSIKMGNSIAIGSNTDSSTTDSIAVGRAASTTGKSAISIGASSSASGDYSIAIGRDTINDAINSVSIGYLSRAGNGDDDGSVIIGAAANGASGTTSTLIGYSASSSGFACTGIGPTARVDDTTPLVIKAGHKTVSDGEQILTMIQGDANGKISLLKGDGTDERMVIQDEIAALKAEIAALKGGASTGDTTGA